MRRFGKIWMALALISAILGCAAPNEGDEPTSVSPPRSPNWALAAPDGVDTAATPTHRSARFAAPPEALIAAFAAAALEDARVSRLDDGSDPTYASFVQRSALLRFPDVVSARAAPLGDGASGLIVYSRSIYGYSDMGVNKARVTRWLEATAERLGR